MFTRSIRSGLVVTSLVAAGLGVGLPAAQADPGSTPGASDYVGVGSDTTQYAVTNLINGATVAGASVGGYNSTVTGSNPKMASWDACTTPPNQQFPCTPGGQIILRSGAAAIDRPNGSGAGKSLLYGSGNNQDVTFARSSSALSTAENNAALRAYPFALDTLVMVTSKNVSSDAPDTLTIDQIVKIYNGTYTNWNQVGGSSGTIKAYVPQAGSGTRSFFEAQLKAANGNTAVVYGPGVNTNAQEHDPTSIQGDKDAIAPFSRGRAVLAGTVRIEKGFAADRALYNVLRSNTADITAHPTWVAGTSQMDAIFGPNGFICSANARPLIEAAGFKQLKTLADGGTCGAYDPNGASSNLHAYNADGLASRTALSVSPGSVSYGQGATVRASVSGSGGVPTGSVVFSAGSWSQTVPLSGGAASATTPSNLPSGSRAVTATYTGDDTFKPSSASGSLSVARVGSSTTASFPAKIKAKKKKGVGTVTVSLPGGLQATGAITLAAKGKVIGSGSLAGGSASVPFKLSKKAVKKKKVVITVTYSGDANTAGSATSVTVKIKK